ncbi:MAG: LuxR C-terminal-related transcriptional regulator [Ilumatobacter sp.]|uniref:helix-turn-helix transcriptional regulator n=1 Tax=Ilumatobacter sp. TaxID=1967498 RepID=UPI0026383DCD|nr:LuxR C-terminal-related transcriptional regulator [Ilumatobacter sp.]MDJ0771726.1 LuxR C-terminal-related transcriptional regulator [Ilumatobacter sp.]
MHEPNRDAEATAARGVRVRSTHRTTAVIRTLAPFFDSLVEPVVCTDAQWRVLYRNPASAASWRIAQGERVALREREDGHATLGLLDHAGHPTDVSFAVTTVADANGRAQVHVGRATADGEGLVAELRHAAAVISARVADLEDRHAHPRNGADEALLDKLSAREREIFDLVLDGKRVATIAKLLFLSENTVRNYLKRIYHKLGVHSLGELRERMAPVHRAS